MPYFQRVVSVVICVLFLHGCAVNEQASQAWFSPGANSETGEVAVYRSPNDDRAYRYFTLENGMEVLLISDPQADKAAASLSVNIGSFENPRDRDGLAHFLEHMLFLGTDKYPEPGEYQSFISEHGGTFNAYTSLEETNYFFDVDARHLMPALDRFSRFFVAPLFNPEYVDRERHAVESEYRLKIKDDSRREWDVLRELANPEHPFSGFSVGSLETLADRPDDPVREDLLAFYQRYYSANQMALVVSGSESLSALETAVRQRFSPVPNHNVSLQNRDIPLFREATPFRVYIKPEKELRTLSFNFPLPTVADFWAEKPLEYLGHLLGHEGDGSFLSVLKKRGLAEGLAAGLVYDSRVGALFAVNISLTPEGLQEQEAITSAFFQWLDNIKTNGLDAWRYGEVAKMNEVEFRFAEKTTPMRYVSSLSNAMHQYPAAEIVRGAYLYQDYDKSVIKQLANLLSAENVAIVVTAPGVKTDQSTVMYQAPYRVETVTAQQLLAANNLALDGLKLPGPNAYIPEELVVNTGGKSGPLPLSAAADSRFWFYEDGQFNTPKALFQARIAVDDMESLRRETLMDLYVALVKDQLSSEAYPAALAGLGFDLGRWTNGLTLNIQGYSEKQSVLLNRVLSVLTAPDWQQQRFDRVKSTLERNWRNTARDWPISQVFAGVGPLLSGGWLPVEKAKELEKISLGELQQFVGSLYGHSQFRFYAGGNLDAASARSMATQVQKKIQPTPHTHSVQPVYRVKNLAESAHLPEFSLHVDHGDHAAVLYLQGHEATLKERALFSVLQVAAEAPFYSQLRTERQLGYVVGSNIVPLNRVPGLVFYVQSPVKDSAGLQHEIDSFFGRFSDTVANLTEADLERYKQSVLANIEEKPKNIMELSARHLESLDMNFDGFDFRDRLANQVRALTLPVFKAGFQRVLQGDREGLWLLSTQSPIPEVLSRDFATGQLEGEFTFPQ